jgi:hypothetical protein
MRHFMADQSPAVEAEFTLLKRHMTPGTGVRGSPRYRCALATLGRVSFPPQNTAQDAWIHDLSKIGAGLNLAKPIQPGTAVVVRLKGGTLILEIPATIIHSTALIDGTWRVGCSFSRKLSAEELDCLL